MLPHGVSVLIHHFEHLREVLAQVMRCSTLDTSTTDRDVELDSCRVLSTGKSFILGLVTTDDGDGEKLFVDVSVDFLDLELELGCALASSVSGVTFLPEELTCADERCGVLELPSDHIGPLVSQEGQITMGSDPFGETGIHDGFRGGSDRDGLGHFTLTTLGDPGDFRGKSFNVILLFVEGSLRHEHWEVDVLNTMKFKLSVSKLLDLLPDEEGVGAEDVAARDIVVLNQFRLGDHLRVPLAEVLLLRVLDAALVHISGGFGGGLLRLLRLLHRLLTLSTFRGWGTLGSRGAPRQLSEVDDRGLVSRKLDDLVLVCLGDGDCCRVIHGVVPDPGCLCQPLVDNELHLLLFVVHQ